MTSGLAHLKTQAGRVKTGGMSQSDGPPAPNITEFTVSELSFAIKRMVESAFEHVRVRGEVGRVARPGSGHIYFDLKDERNVLSAVVWKGTAGKLRHLPEQGLEIVATGRLTTFPGQSRYQIVVEHLEPAGAGALMALLEERRRTLAAEGLFSQERKKPLPYLPHVIGVVTSPTGAVIRDILHRLADRFPTRVLVWPVRVQGETCADEVAAAVRGFNALSPKGRIPRPDLLIVARGGGSIEDLWGFNEEAAVRAVAESDIPVISAIGHETDTALTDFAADLRAPTPTAAAEHAVPVREELLANVADRGSRLWLAMDRSRQARRRELDTAARGLPGLSDLVALPRQRLDFAAARLGHGLQALAAARRQAFTAVAARMRPRILQMARVSLADRLVAVAARGDRAWGQQIRQARRDFSTFGDRLAPTLLVAGLARERGRVAQIARLLDGYSYTATLKRGFAIVRDAADRPVRAAAALTPGDTLSLEFADGRVGAVAGGLSGQPDKPTVRRQSAGGRSSSDQSEPGRGGQGDLF